MNKVGEAHYFTVYPDLPHVFGHTHANNYSDFLSYSLNISIICIDWSLSNIPMNDMAIGILETGPINAAYTYVKYNIWWDVKLNNETST